MDIAALAALNPNLDAAALAEEFALVRDACRPFDLAAFREGHLDAGVLRPCAEELRRRRPARRLRRLRAAAARRRRPTPAASPPQEPQHDGLRVQDPGQHGSEPPRPHRLRAAVLGQADARHEGEACAHRQGDRAARAAFLLRAGPRHRRRGLCRRRRRHSQPRQSAHRRHADRRREPSTSSACRASRRKSSAGSGSPTR